MQDFPANSQRAKPTEPPREKLEAVTSATTVRRKRGLGRQFKQTFFSGSARDALEFTLTEVVVPTVRDLFADAMQSSIDRMIYGDRGGRTRRGANPLAPTNAGHVAYNRMSSSPTPQQTAPPRSLSRRSRARHSFDELIIPSAREANEVIDQMFDILSRYGRVSVADLYELTGIQSSHTDEKWGWTALRGAKAMRLRQGGFLLDLPEPEAFA